MTELVKSNWLSRLTNTVRNDDFHDRHQHRTARKNFRHSELNCSIAIGFALLAFNQREPFQSSAQRLDRSRFAGLKSKLEPL